MIKIKPENKGKLHQALGLKSNAPIPAADLMKALHSKIGAVRKMATFAQNAGKWHHK